MEIKVSTASWHCRLLDFKDKYLDNTVGLGRPTTLCSYFWGVIFAPAKIAFVWWVYTIVFLFGVDYEHAGERGDICLKHKPAFWTSLITLTVMLYLVIPFMFFFEAENYEGFLIAGTAIFEMICLIVVVQKLKEVYDDRPYTPSEQKGDSFLTLTWKMVKAGKRKMCPFIEYKEVT